MSTHSAIITKTATGYAGIYCHSDGYPEWVGRILLDHYTDQTKVDALIALVWLSCLGRNLAGNGTHLGTVAYGRDWGEGDCDAIKGERLKDVVNAIDAHYVYVFENGAWTLNGKPLAPQIDMAKSDEYFRNYRES